MPNQRFRGSRDRTAVVILIDAHEAIIDRCRGGTLARMQCIPAPRPYGTPAHMGDAPRRFYHPGTRGETAAEAAQRSHNAMQARFVGEVAPVVSAAAGPGEWIVIGGNRHLAAALCRGLPGGREPAAIVVGGLHRMLDAETLVARVHAAVDAHLAARDLADVRTLLERTGAHATGVVGPLASLDAAEHGAVDVLLVSPTYRARYPEEATRLAVATTTHGGRVETVEAPAAAVLDARAGGVGALLRFTPHRVPWNGPDE